MSSYEFNEQIDAVPANDSPTPLKPPRSLSPCLVELLTLRDGLLPVWIRAPKSGPEHYSGLSRAKLYELAKRNKIRTKSIREEKWHTRGTRLFHLASILQFIEEAPDDERSV
tara:strand:+ start:434 stop:769 length:336 start_codon:yes stop_codon:yes gene_type:complete